MTREQLALLALGVSCAGAPPPRATCSIVARPVDRYFVVGERAEVEVALDELCSNNTDPALHTAASVVAEVRDPEGVPVASIVSAPVRRARGINNFGNSAMVWFTPTRTGAWSVTSRFEPEIGRTSGAALVIVDRADAGARVSQGEFPSGCTGWGMTARGTVLCVYPRDTTGHSLRTQRGEVFGGDAFVVDGNAVWAVSGSSLTRLEDNGVALKPTHGTFVPLAAPVSAAAGARAGDVWVGTGAGTPGMNELFRIEPFPDGGTAVFPRALPSFRLAGIAAHADGVLLAGTDEATENPAIGFVGNDGGTVKAPVAGFRFHSGEPGALWFTRANGLTAVTWANGALTQSFADQPIGAFTGRLPAPLFPQTPVVPFTAGVQNEEGPVRVAARFDGAKVVLERFVAGDGYGIAGATPTHVFARAIDGTSVKVFER